jgi:hypothetical protein
MPPHWLSRRETIARLRAYAATWGYASAEEVYKRDRLLDRSVRHHFPGLPAARYAAGVPGPPNKMPKGVTGPKPGTKAKPRPLLWSRERVIDELRELSRAGVSTTLQDLYIAGRANLVGAARDYAGGLKNARRLAGVAAPKRKAPKKRELLSATAVLRELRRRRAAGESLATSEVPQSLYGAARRRFGSWPNAIARLGLDAKEVRVSTKKYTKEVIIDRLRRAARSGNDLRSTSLRSVLDLKAVLREFGTLGNAIVAAGLAKHLARRPRRNAKWTRQSVLDAIRDAHARGARWSSSLYRFARNHFVDADAARRAAGVPVTDRSASSVRSWVTRRKTEPAWTRERLIEVMRSRARENLPVFTSTLYQRARAAFGGAEQALTAAGLETAQRWSLRPRRTRTSPRRRRSAWTRERIIETLRQRAARGVHVLDGPQYRASRLVFGGAREARAAAGVPDPVDLRIARRRKEARAFESRHRTPSRRNRSGG